jgi:CheY-like chemotaxis protein
MLMTNVLLIDDDALSRRVVRTMLEDLACDVTEAEDGAVASSKMEGRDFDLVVTDIFMPNQDGIETIRKIRRARNDVCILAISADDANVDVNYLKMAERIGADYSLSKPIKSEQLKGIIGNLKVSV